ncbi:Crp/Fnr family transcriptional regulator [Anaerofustis butyriciformans]|uniref:Crp/Fnr family transcriptional regulator n=1 Tax=Anaerofustis butyriciformans TaxID=3108533 RepID=UPI002E362555|nr:Crp/Fnr family transcriptional regulator [Anaerofustis sp. HA2171]
MDKYFDILLKCPLFKGVEKNQLKSMIKCLKGKIITVKKNENIFFEGELTQNFGIVLIGKIKIIRDDYYGNRSVLTILKESEMFAEVFAFAGLNTFPVSAVADKDSEIMLLNTDKVMTMCSASCHYHNLVIKNLLKEMAQKTLSLNKKIRYMSEKTTKNKLMLYLLDQAKQNNSCEFTIPFDRQALADYLGVERSAMSAEIGKLKKLGIIDTKGSWFNVKKIDEDI